MAFKFTKNTSKSTIRAKVTRMHKMFKRFKKRFASTNNVSQKRFCKSEAVKVCRQLKTIAKQYKKYGFGVTSWITKNYNMTNFISGNRTNRKTRRNSKRTYARRTSRSYGRRTRSWSKRRTSRTRTTRKVYVAW